MNLKPLSASLTVFGLFSRALAGTPIQLRSSLPQADALQNSLVAFALATLSWLHTLLH